MHTNFDHLMNKLFPLVSSSLNLLGVLQHSRRAVARCRSCLPAVKMSASTWSSRWAPGIMRQTRLQLLRNCMCLLRAQSPLSACSTVQNSNIWVPNCRTLMSQNHDWPCFGRPGVAGHGGVRRWDAAGLASSPWLCMQSQRGVEGVTEEC